MQKNRILLLLLIVAAIGAAVYFTQGGSGQRPAGGGPSVGTPAPDFTLTDMQGQPVSLSQFHGKIVFLNFWASWCPPCREEMPAMERLNQVFADRDFVMLAVNTEQDIQAVRTFLERNPHSFPVLLDPQAQAQQLYRVFRFPETFLIDKDGRILEHYLGARDWSSVQFLRYIDSLIKEQ